MTYHNEADICTRDWTQCRPPRPQHFAYWSVHPLCSSTGKLILIFFSLSQHLGGKMDTFLLHALTLQYVLECKVTGLMLGHASVFGHSHADLVYSKCKYWRFNLLCAVVLTKVRRIVKIYQGLRGGTQLHTNLLDT